MTTLLALLEITGVAIAERRCIRAGSVLAASYGIAKIGAAALESIARQPGCWRHPRQYGCLLLSLKAFLFRHHHLYISYSTLKDYNDGLNHSRLRLTFGCCYHLAS